MQVIPRKLSCGLMHYLYQYGLREDTIESGLHQTVLLLNSIELGYLGLLAIVQMQHRILMQGSKMRST